MRKATRITYSPFTNRIHFETRMSECDAWKDLPGSSELLDYENKHVLFSNCVKSIVEAIDENQNSTQEGLEIQFEGPEPDFMRLERCVSGRSTRRAGRGPLSCRLVATYPSSKQLLETVRQCYRRIASEFRDFLPGNPGYEGDGVALGDAIATFEMTVSDAIPVCVIGSMSVGKSALINAMIGDEVLPSRQNASTARNVRVLESRRYAVSVQYSMGGTAHGLTFEVTPGSISPASEDDLCEEICARLADVVRPWGKRETQIVRELIDFLNDAPEETRDPEIRERVGWNVTVEVPFRHEYATDADNPIILYDTPGSDNTDINHEQHDEALRAFLGSQTNTLPVLVTNRSQVTSTSNIRNQIDEYSQNFASPCCLVVLTKCDTLGQPDLQEPISPTLRKWHGEPVILYTTPIGALGYRKRDDVPWLHEGYEEAYVRWRRNQEHKDTHVCLPEYNSDPRGDKPSAEDLCVDEKLYDTGIPSFEREIAYYIDNFARYKKCVRGRDDLVKSMETMRAMLRAKERETNKAKTDAEIERRSVRARLGAELGRIQIENVVGLAERLESQFEDRLERYCESVTGVLEGVYDEFKDKDPQDMNRRASERLREHCQRNLIDACYLGPEGARDLIVSEMERRARNYAKKLHAYVESNEPHFSDVSNSRLREYLESASATPTFKDVNSVLGDIAELFDQVALVKNGILRTLGQPGFARDVWVHDKRGSFEGRLMDSHSLLGKSEGIFSSVVFSQPIANYYHQLVKWAEEHRQYVREQLDEDNAILSGMETRIRALEEREDDLRRRLADLDDVEQRLGGLLEPESKGLS